MYVKVTLTLLVVATAMLAIAMFPRTPSAAIAPDRFEAVLRRPVDSFELRDTPATEAVRILREKTSADIQIDWNSFETADPPFERTETVTLSLNRLTLADALLDVFNSKSAHYVTFDTVGNTVRVYGSTLPGVLVTARAYDVRDLLSDEYWAVKSPSDQRAAIQDQRMSDLIGLFSNYLDRREWDPAFSNTIRNACRSAPARPAHSSARWEQGRREPEHQPRRRQDLDLQSGAGKARFPRRRQRQSLGRHSRPGKNMDL